MNYKLEINGENVDIDESVITPLTYAIADIKNPEKRQRNRSKTIRIKGTQNNLRLFYSAYNLSLDDDGIGFDFNPNAELTARFYQDGALIFNGVANYLQTTISGGVKFFEFQIFGNSVELFEKLGDLKLSELDWSEYNHALTVANLELSWNTSVVKNGVPTSNFTAGVPDGFGYLYGLANWGYASNQKTPKTNELIPQFYIKEALEKCFAFGGYTIGGNFIDGITRIVGSKGGGERVTIDGTEVTARKVEYNFTGTDDNTVTYGGSQYNNNPASPSYRLTYYLNQEYKLATISPVTSALVQDNRTQFDTSTGILTISSSGSYDIEFDIDMNVDKIQFTGGTYGSNGLTGRITYIIKENGTPRIFTQNISLGSNTNTVKLQGFYRAGDELEFSFKLDFVQAYCYVSQLSDAPVVEYDWTINSFNVDVNAIDKELVEGDTVDFGRWIPEIKCRDFVNGIIAMANLYLSEPTEDNVIRVEPFGSYYGDTSDADNWTLKLDHTKEQRISSNAGIEGKVYNFRFAEDRDAYKQHYFDRWGSDYGDYVYNVPSTFKKGEKNYTIPFAQTVPIQVDDLIIPQIVKKDAVTNIVSPYKGKPRIFIYNGLKTGAWTLKNSTTGAGTAEASYPQLHHTQNVSSPIFDLNFGVPIEIYYTATAYTTNNLFSNYYDAFLKELTSVDTKILTAYFKLNATDLQGEFMRDLVNINGVVYRKNIIADYDATGNETTKVQLVKVLEADSRASTTIAQPTENQNSTLRIGTPIQPPTRTITSDDTATVFDGVIVADTTLNDIEITLSNDVPIGHTWKFFKSSNNGVLTVVGEDGTPVNDETDGASADYIYTAFNVMKDNNEEFIIIS